MAEWWIIEPALRARRSAQECPMTAAARRHCMVVDNTYPDPRVEREANALLERGYHVDVICQLSRGAPRTEHDGRLSIYRLPVKRRRGASALVQLWEYLAFGAWATAMVTLRHLRARYDVVQVHNVPDFLVFSAVVPKRRGAGPQRAGLPGVQRRRAEAAGRVGHPGPSRPHA
jgi:hypothetical protein